MPEVIFILLNLVFLFSLLYFVNSSVNGAGAYERIYAKEIALAIDSANPDTQISFNFERGLELTKGITENVVSFTENEVMIKLGDKGGYGMKFFSDYKIEHFFVDKELVITLKKNDA